MYKVFLSSIIAVTSCSLCGLVAHQSVEHRLDDLEKQMKEVSVKNSSGTNGAMFAQGRNPDANCEWYIDMEALLWHVKSGSTDWAIVFDQAILPSKGNMKTLGFDWDWGLRVGIGEYFKHDGWDLGLLYTYYRTSDSSSVSVPFQTPAGTDGPEGSAGPSGVSDGTFSAKVSYNSIDLGFGKSYFTSKNMMVHPHIGIKNMWIVEKYKLGTGNFIDALETFTPVAGTVDTALQNNNKLWGIGPHVGMDFSWFLCNNFKFVTTAEAALLQGYFQVKQAEKINVAPIGSTPVFTTIKLGGNMHRFVPFGRLLLGLGWGECFNDNKQRIDVSLNYEVNYFWRENQMINEINSDPSAVSFSANESIRLLLERLSEDIGFYGVTFKVKIDF